jgi:lambda family phage portal protein
MGLRTRVISGIRRAFGFGPARASGGLPGASLLRSRLLAEAQSLYASPDSYLRGGIREWRAKARAQVLSNPYARQIQRALEINLVGPQGIALRGAVPAEQAGSERETALDPERNRILELEWSRFCHPDSFDVAGLRSFHQFELAIAASFAAYGGCLVRIVREAAGRSRIPICFELISVEQLDEQYTQRSNIAGRHWRMGVEYDDRTGRRTRYAILQRHPGDLEFETSRPDLAKHRFVDARDIIHVFIPEEIGQTRERPWLLPVLTTIQHIYDYEQAHWTRKKVVNNTLGFIRKPEPDAPGMIDSSSSLASETDPTTGEIISRSAPGQWIELLPGEEPVPPSFGPDDQMYPQVLKTMLRRMASGVGMSYAGLTKDFSDTNYSSSRMSELQDRDGWRTLQRQIVAIFHQRVYEEWFDAAMISGALPIELFGDYYANPHRYLHPRWIPRSWSFIDPTREMNAYAIARNLGLQSAGEQIAEIYGHDLEATWAQIAYEKQLAEELGIEFATLAPGQIPNSAAGGKAKEDGAPEEQSDDA